MRLEQTINEPIRNYRVIIKGPKAWWILYDGYQREAIEVYEKYKAAGAQIERY